MSEQLLDLLISRLSRHLLVDGWSCTEQRLLDSLRIAIVGAGGLGSTVSIMLCSASASGSLRHIFDNDVVDISNLHRQIAFTESDVNQPKADCLRDACASRNSSAKVTSSRTRISSANASELLCDFDVIFDCTDNLESRIAISDAWIKLGRRQVLVSASCVGWSGKIVIFAPSSLCCVRCLYSGISSDDACHHSGQCAVQGVMGPVVGLVANLQVLEFFNYIKTVCGRPTKVAKNPAVRLVDLSQGGLWNYQYDLVPSCDVCCGVVPPSRATQTAKSPAAVPEISGEEFTHRLSIQSEQILVMDVREKNHFELSRIRGSFNFPASRFLRQDTSLEPMRILLKQNPTCSVIVVCRKGINSAKFVSQISPHFSPSHRFFSLKGGLLGLNVSGFV